VEEPRSTCKLFSSSNICSNSSKHLTQEIIKIKLFKAKQLRLQDLATRIAMMLGFPQGIILKNLKANRFRIINSSSSSQFIKRM